MRKCFQFSNSGGGEDTTTAIFTTLIYNMLKIEKEFGRKFQTH